MLGEEFTTNDEVRLVPDILQNGDDFFFPVFSSEEEMQLTNLENLLDDLLSQECPLCGDEMILSTQIKFGDEDNKDWLI